MHASTAQAKLMGARHSRYGGTKILTKRIRLAIPAFVDLFTLYLRDAQSLYGSAETGFRSPGLAPMPASGFSPQSYLRRDFALDTAMTANGGATAMSTSTNTITKPNMIFSLSFGFSVEQDKDVLQKRRWPSPFGMR
jgi:hypothetical protein